MLDGHPLVDVHVHVPVLSTLTQPWIDWARRFGTEGLLERAWSQDGTPLPGVIDGIFEDQGVDIAVLFCEYSPKATGMQLFEDLLPIVEHNPRRFRPMGNVNPHLHHPIGDEVRRQLALGAAGLKLHPVHGGFRCDDPMLYPAYQVLVEEQAPLVVHCGTSTFAGSSNQYADPTYLLAVTRDFPDLDIILAHGGRGWWYEQAAFMALSNPHVWIELSGLPPGRLPDYYAAAGLDRLAKKMIFATDWPGVPSTEGNARAIAELVPPADVAAVLGGNALRLYRGLTRMD